MHYNIAYDINAAALVSTDNAGLTDKQRKRKKKKKKKKKREREREREWEGGSAYRYPLGVRRAHNRVQGLYVL